MNVALRGMKKNVSVEYKNNRVLSLTSASRRICLDAVMWVCGSFDIDLEGLFDISIITGLRAEQTLRCRFFWGVKQTELLSAFWIKV
jgi:hypothetical protein